MDMADLVISTAKSILSVALPVILTWALMRDKNKADTAKALADARLTEAQADRANMENRVEKVVSAALDKQTERLDRMEANIKRNADSVAQLGEGIALIKHEVLPNTGTSLNDAVRRSEASIEVLNEKFDLSKQDREDLHRLIESESLRQRERELDARREHEDFRKQIQALQKARL